MRTKNKPWAKPYLEEHSDYSLSDEDLSSLDNFYLEIGSGKGDFIVQMAEKFPNRYFLGIEKNFTCAAISLKKIVTKELKNVKFLCKDATEIMKLFKDRSVNIIYLNFSDPWPKKRHAKRRLTSVSFLDEYKRVLKSDGKIIFKTDNTEMFDYSLEMFKSAGFNIPFYTYDYQLDSDDALTEYENKFRLAGVAIKKVVVTL